MHQASGIQILFDCFDPIRSDSTSAECASGALLLDKPMEMDFSKTERSKV